MMTVAEWFEAFSVMHGTSPRPQPWQLELVQRLLDKRLAAKEAGKPFHLIANWGSGNRRFFEQWQQESGPFRRFFYSAGYGNKDESKVLVMKSRSVGRSWDPPKPTIVICDEIAYMPVTEPKPETLDVLDFMLWARQSGKTATKTAFITSRSESPPKKKAHQPFYRKFQPKRRLA